MYRNAHEQQTNHFGWLYQHRPWEFTTYYNPPTDPDERRRQYIAEEYIVRSALTAEDLKQYDATKKELATPTLPHEAIAYHHSDKEMRYPIRIWDPALRAEQHSTEQERLAKQRNALALPALEQNLRLRLHEELHGDGAECDCFPAPPQPGPAQRPPVQPSGRPSVAINGSPIYSGHQTWSAPRHDSPYPAIPPTSTAQLLPSQPGRPAISLTSAGTHKVIPERRDSATGEATGARGERLSQQGKEV